MSFFSGTKGKYKQKSLLGPEQQAGYQDLQTAAQGKGGSGAFGQAQNYFSNLLSDNSADYNAFAAPELRRFNEQIIPDLSEQFAGMGSGGSGLSGSGFRNAAVNAGTDLSERLGAIRAQLRQQGAQGLTNIGQQALGQFNENVYEPPTPGFFESAAPAIGSAVGSFGGGALSSAANWLTRKKKPEA